MTARLVKVVRRETKPLVSHINLTIDSVHRLNIFVSYTAIDTQHFRLVTTITFPILHTKYVFGRAAEILHSIFIKLSIRILFGAITLPRCPFVMLLNVLGHKTGLMTVELLCGFKNIVLYQQAPTA